MQDFGDEVFEVDTTAQFRNNVMYLLAHLCRDQEAMKEEMRRFANRNPFPRGLR